MLFRSPKDPAPPKVELPAAPTPSAAPAAAPANQPADLAGETPLDAAPIPAGNVSVTVDVVTKPGTMVSGNVTFSDGESAAWYMDQMGRLGVVAKTQGYKPSAADVQTFQDGLEAEFKKLGF